MNKIRDNIGNIILFVVISTTLVSTYFIYQSNALFFINTQINEMLFATIYRVVLGVFFLIMMVRFGYKFYSLNVSYKEFVFILVPGILIAINNFPISAFMNDRYVLISPSVTILVVLLFTLGTAFLEEIVFRSVIFTAVIQMLPKTKKGLFYSVMISSLFFGLMHLVNIFDGASVPNTLLQVGYSFLMGSLWSVVFLKTKSIWSSILLHWLYNFFGFVLFEVGVVLNRYDTITVVTTILIGIIGTVYYYMVFDSLEPVEVHKFVSPEGETND